ncbi:hypothetical protein [Coxiella-like endosymbiont]|uniref:hypothetical protein n=1 Tax=Coxiella-like endosymbiont TaxID=1592897 RepID=UPI00272A6F80|nr:hypothetical protein [Coxiella-like endosymbiont]
MYFAALYNFSDVIPLLIMVEADLVTTTKYDDTPLMIGQTARSHGGYQHTAQFFGVTDIRPTRPSNKTSKSKHRD